MDETKKDRLIYLMAQYIMGNSNPECTIFWTLKHEFEELLSEWEDEVNKPAEDFIRDFLEDEN